MGVAHAGHLLARPAPSGARPLRARVIVAQLGFSVAAGLCHAFVLTVRVADDGLGMPATPDTGTASGVGLSNTRARLARLYGDGGTLRVANRSSGGVEAVVRLPLERASAAGAPGTTGPAVAGPPTAPLSAGDVQRA